MLPAGTLPKWLLFVSVLSVFNTAQCFLDAEATLTRMVYANAPSQVTALSTRTFGIWTLLSAFIRIYGAYHIFSPQ
jgi:hypothetical protein